MAGGNQPNRKMKKELVNQPLICTSEIHQVIYERLRLDGRLPRFIACIQECSSRGLSLEDTLNVILEAFPRYISKKEITVKAFNDMLKSYGDIATAWGYGENGDVITSRMIRNHAVDLAMASNSIEDVVMYHEVFESENPSIDAESSKTVVNFNLMKSSS